MDLGAFIRASVLPHWPGLEGGMVTALGAGLINQTFLIDGAGGQFVLQRVNPIFPPEIHENIRAVTQRLSDWGLVTPVLLPTRAGRPCLELAAEGVWRAMTFVNGVSFDVVGGAGQAYAAGALVARFHDALEALPHRFVGMRVGVHDTPRHLAKLREVIPSAVKHRLFGAVGVLAKEILSGAEAMPPLPVLPDRVCHGDLKFNNLLFAGWDPPANEQALCLIDLDTVGPMSLAYELGDAWRSWCNRAGEDAPEATLDLEVMRASLEGYRAGLGRALDEEERRALFLGVEWISLELAARFAADALLESYFGWDPRRFPGRGEHNLVRARGQWSLHKALLATRAERAAMLDLG